MISYADEAQVLAAVKALDDEVVAWTMIQQIDRQASFNKQDQRWLAEAKLRAERRFGELIGPADGPGRPRGNVTGSHISGAERAARKWARKVAYDVPEAGFEAYLTACRSRGTKPARATLLKMYPSGPHKPPGSPKESGHAKSPRTALEVNRIKDPDTNKAAEYVARRLLEEAPAEVLRKVVLNLKDSIMDKRGRPKNWDGKSNDWHLRELAAMKAKPRQVRLIGEYYKMGSVLEDISPADFDLQGVTAWEAGLVLDSLITLGEWIDRTTSGLQGWLDDGDVRAKIAILRDASGRTAEEATTAARIADRLELRLVSRLTA
jgi:hypothetical protein